MIVISCHSDTNFKHHELTRERDGYLGYLDNFAGVYAAMRAFFSGRLGGPYVRIALTDHEETDFAGAYELLAQLDPKDLVVVLDVTGIIGDWDFTIEKCSDPAARQFVEKALDGFNYKLFENSPDPIADSDEVDVYKEKCPHTFFLGVPCSGGDYNKEKVFCKESSLQKVSEALIALCAAYPKATFT
jgi:hypothetical protein